MSFFDVISPKGVPETSPLTFDDIHKFAVSCPCL